MDDTASLATLVWVDEGNFSPLDNVTLKSFMDLPVRPWVDDFTPTERHRYKNLKCLLPGRRVLPSLVPIVKEFGSNWDPQWQRKVWEEGRRSMRAENVVE